MNSAIVEYNQISVIIQNNIDGLHLTLDARNLLCFVLVNDHDFTRYSPISQKTFTAFLYFLSPVNRLVNLISSSTAYFTSVLISSF